MIVSEVMTTRLVTVTSDDTLGHAANLLRQYQFHHLPVIRSGQAFYGMPLDTKRGQRPAFEGLLTSQDIDVAAAAGTSSSEILHRPWQERRVVELMHRATMRVTPTTSVAAAAQILVERGLNCLPVVEYESPDNATSAPGNGAATLAVARPAPGTDGTTSEGTGAVPADARAEQAPAQALLVGLLTRSDLLIALARSLGAFEPGMQLSIPLPMGDLTPLVTALQLAAELRIQVRSVLAAPLDGPVPLVATVRLGTIHPAPLLVRLQEVHIHFTFADEM
jgi:acetoin utilization protein AcuB